MRTASQLASVRLLLAPKPPLPMTKRRILPALILALALMIAACPANADNNPEEKGARLILSSSNIEPTTTFELRFDDPVAAPEQAGLPAKDSPLLFSPPLAGAFSWLSQRSGVFTPSQPPALGTTYRVTLDSHLLTWDKKPVTASIDRSFSTPPMAVLDTHPAFEDDDLKNAPSNPVIHIQFNVDISAAEASPFIVFRDVHGTEIPALVTQGKDDPNLPWEFRKLETWKERFDLARGKSTRKRFNRYQEDDEDEPPSTSPAIRSLLTVTPSRPLPLGTGWCLHIRKDFPGTQQHLAADVELKIGDVKPFVLRGCDAR